MRFTHSPERPLTPMERLDTAGNQESCVRVDGGNDGANVANDGPDDVQTAQLTLEGSYGKITALEAGKSQRVAKNTVRDFWAVGVGQARVTVTRD